ncbi:GspE/PulE family protein [Ethanoligenens harbinense]|uniref:Type II secretion system protein E n=1 Tax=Ethanoligenens harbinense (strain DSM 18485 / JCM 12961 / CGMCC 1.5033 / YUAN-3) TaxID=663278 RepID=E6U2Z3_ETHHY|nr:type II secretion system protein E [Ethanoligenens harbinense YUAN-3]
MAMKNLRIGEMLLEENLITQAQLDAALARKKEGDHNKLGDILVEMGSVSEKELTRMLGTRLKVPVVDLVETGIDQHVPDLIPEELAKKYMVIPIAQDGQILTVATSDPMNFYAIDDLRLATNLEIKPVLATSTDIKNAISHYYSRKLAEEAAEDVNREFNFNSMVDAGNLLGEKVDNAPVVRLVASIIQQGIKFGASDLHIEPSETETRIRMRVDGVLKPLMSLAAAAHASVVTRIKIMGNMNIAERRVPQDGRVEIVIDGRPVDMRLSVLPTVTGEKVVIRILGGQDAVRSVNDLGLSAENRALFEKITRSPNGILLVSGPTGSGKSTTLYSILNQLNQPGVNIITVEDPVEYRMPGANQVQVNPKAGLTFASGLRSILRQDPDIIMIGEIRDAETAQIAIRAAITGHLVLSTIHTNDAASTVTRLVDMGVEPFLVSSAVIGIIAQRLVRKICPRCKQPYTPSDSECRLLGIPVQSTLYRGTGCNYCDHTGYKGRTAIHEIMAISHDVRELIDNEAATDEIRAQIVRDGTITLQECCKQLVLNGVTTREELLRATYSIG